MISYMKEEYVMIMEQEYKRHLFYKISVKWLRHCGSVYLMSTNTSMLFIGSKDGEFKSHCSFQIFKMCSPYLQNARK